MQLSIQDLIKNDYTKSLLGKTELKAIRRTGRAHDIKRVKQQLAKGYSVVQIRGRGKNVIITLDKPKLIGRNGDSLRAEFIKSKAAEIVKVVLLQGNSRSMTAWLNELGLNRTQQARQELNKIKLPSWRDTNSLTKGDALVILSDIERFNLGLAKAALKVVADTYQVRITNVVYGIWERDIKLSMTREERQAKVRRLSSKTIAKLDAARDSIIAANKDINIFNVYTSKPWADSLKEIGLWKCWKETELTGLTADKIKGHKVDLAQDSTQQLSWLELYQQHLTELENKYSSWDATWDSNLLDWLESGFVTKQDIAEQLGRSLKDRKAYRAYRGQLSQLFNELKDLLKQHEVSL